MAIVKKSKNNKCWWECGEKRTLYTVGGNVNWCRRETKQYAGSSKTMKIELPAVPRLSLKDTCTPMFIAALFKKPRYASNPSVHQQMDKTGTVCTHMHTTHTRIHIMECYSAIKRTKPCHLQQHGCTKRTLCLVKSDRKRQILYDIIYM